MDFAGASFVLSGLQQTCLEFFISAGIIRTVLGLTMIESIGASADSKDWRGLDTLGDCHSGEEVPPALKIGDE